MDSEALRDMPDLHKKPCCLCTWRLLVLALCWLGPLPAMSRTAFSAISAPPGVTALGRALLAIGSPARGGCA